MTHTTSQIDELAGAANPHSKWLRKAAEEIRAGDYVGWGNTCEQGADEIDRLTARIRELEAELKLALREMNDKRYMLVAVLGMLGPIGQKVWQVWQAKNIKRIHHDWGPEAPHGEDRAIFLLDLEERLKTATKVEFPERIRAAAPAKGDVVREALRFYADDQNWQHYSGRIHQNSVQEDHGGRARDALAAMPDVEQVRKEALEEAANLVNEMGTGRGEVMLGLCSRMVER